MERESGNWPKTNLDIGIYDNSMKNVGQDTDNISKRMLNIEYPSISGGCLHLFTI